MADTPEDDPDDFEIINDPSQLGPPPERTDEDDEAPRVKPIGGDGMPSALGQTSLGQQPNSPTGSGAAYYNMPSGISGPNPIETTLKEILVELTKARSELERIRNHLLSD